MSKDFSSLGISANLLAKLSSLGIKHPTEVQEAAIPAILAGKNLLVQSPTGTGKTLAYLLPLLERLNAGTKDLELLVLVPSRELAFQVVGVIRSLDDRLGLAALTGGANLERQLQALKEKPKVAVGTPGRVLELFQRKKINGQTIRAIVVDETDKMLSAGFMRDVLAIFKKTLRTRQGLFFSATIPRQILPEVSALMAKPAELMIINRAGFVPEQIKHHYLMCDKSKKPVVIEKLLKICRPQKAMVFMGRNEGVSFLTEYLLKKGFAAVGLHSDLSELKRKNLLSAFQEGEATVLVTTDLLARGMDVEGVDYIFNYDLPRDTKQYLHRAGRTGRAGKDGTAMSLVSEQQKFHFYNIGRDLKIVFEEKGLDAERNRLFNVQYRKKRAGQNEPNKNDFNRRKR